MIRLTREVRFALNLAPADGKPGPVHNAFAGHPPILGDAIYLRLALTVEGTLDPSSQYLLNIKDMDDLVRSQVIPLLSRSAGARAMDRVLADQAEQFSVLREAVARLPGSAERGVRLVASELYLSPFQSVCVRVEEMPMVRLSCMFEFSAAHRLHNPALSDADNVTTFGKCNNPLGHGHNYSVQVTVQGTPGSAGGLPGVAELERIVNETVIRAFDHKHLNLEVREFRDRSQGGDGVIPSVENIAAAAFRRLKAPLGSQLAGVTVWETPKTFAEYSE